MISCSNIYVCVLVFLCSCSWSCPITKLCNNLSVALCVFGCMCECIRVYLCLLQSIRCSSLSLFLSSSPLIGLLLYPSPLIGRCQKHDELNKKAFVVGAHGRVRVDIEEVGNALQNKTSPTSDCLCASLLIFLHRA